PTVLSPNYSVDCEPMKEDLKEDLEEEPSEEEVKPLAPVVSASSLPDSVSAYEETQPFEEDEVTPTPPLLTSPHHIIPLSQTRLRGARIWVATPAPLLPPPSPLSPLSYPLPRIPSLPLLLPPPTHKDSIPEADMPPWRRARFAAPSYRFEIGESSAAAAARQPGREAWTLAMDRLREMQIEVRDLQQQRRDGVDRLTKAMRRIRGLEDAREPERRDGPLDAGSSY
ncbi:hypothetical protein Tco_0380933, partial [Tanacetum coccineum]